MCPNQCELRVEKEDRFVLNTDLSVCPYPYVFRTVKGSALKYHNLRNFTSTVVGFETLNKSRSAGVFYLSVFENKDKIVIVMEYASRGDLYDYICDKRTISEREARHFFRQIVSAVHYCHQVKQTFSIQCFQ